MARPSELTDFAHNAEREFASLLDFYRVRWDYEPVTFVLAAGPDGCPTSAFTPDFHLPDFDRYIEVTTLSQPLVTAKNRKVRMLRQQVPGIDIQIVYRNDYLELLVKYGLDRPEQDTSGPKRCVAASEDPGLLGAGPLTDVGLPSRVVPAA